MKPKRRGSMFVEATLVTLLALVCLIGIVDVGTVLVLHQGLNERVRAGGRWAVVHSYNPTRIRNVVLYNTPDPLMGDEQVVLQKPLLGIQNSMVAVSLHGAGTPEARIRVAIVNYRFRFLTPIIARAYVARPIFVTVPAEGMGAAL